MSFFARLLLLTTSPTSVRSFAVVSQQKKKKTPLVRRAMSSSSYDYTVDDVGEDDGSWSGTWYPREERMQPNPFFTLWKDSFDEAPLKLTDEAPEEDPLKDVNYKDYSLATKQTKPFVVFDGAGPRGMRGNTLAVRDSQRKDRYFFGQRVGPYSFQGSLVGGVAYFDDDTGHRKHHELAPVELFDFDSRNGLSDCESVFFCDDVVFFVWKHRDYRSEIRVKGFKLTERDQVAGSFEFKHRCARWYWDGFFGVVDGRWLFFPSDPDDETARA